jgi:hypothetical protein
MIASLLWGTTFVASQVGLQYANPYTLVLARVLGGQENRWQARDKLFPKKEMSRNVRIIDKGHSQ